MFVTWLYNGKLMYTTSDERSNIKQDFARLKCSVGESERWKYNHKDPSSWPTHVLVELYIFADRLDINELRIDLIAALKDSVDTSSYSLYTPAYDYIDSNTTAKSPLRRFVVDQLAYDANRSPANANFWRALPQDITIEALLILSQRVPRRLCSSCHRKGLSWNLVRYNPSQQQTYDAPSYQIDLCLYHGHVDEAEKEACRARSLKAVND